MVFRWISIYHNLYREAGMFSWLFSGLLPRLATGLYIAPAVSGYEPKYQKLGVNVLFGALLIVVLGSLTGQWLGVMQKLGLVDNFYGDIRVMNI